ncbi:MAG TPA: hypothetical protein VIH42_03195 [Thermoguttaceae bacterium]
MADGELLCQIQLLGATGLPVEDSPSALLIIEEMQANGSVKRYDFSDDTFKTADVILPAANLIDQYMDEIHTGTYSYVHAELTAFTKGKMYAFVVNCDDATPSWYRQEFQYGDGGFLSSETLQNLLYSIHGRPTQMIKPDGDDEADGYTWATAKQTPEGVDLDDGVKIIIFGDHTVTATVDYTGYNSLFLDGSGIASKITCATADVPTMEMDGEGCQIGKVWIDNTATGGTSNALNLDGIRHFRFDGASVTSQYARAVNIPEYSGFILSSDSYFHGAEYGFNAESITTNLTGGILIDKSYADTGGWDGCTTTPFAISADVSLIKDSLAQGIEPATNFSGLPVAAIAFNPGQDTSVNVVDSCALRAVHLRPGGDFLSYAYTIYALGAKAYISNSMMYSAAGDEAKKIYSATFFGGDPVYSIIDVCNTPIITSEVKADEGNVVNIGSPAIDKDGNDLALESGGKLEDLETTVGMAGAGLTDLGDTRLTNLDAAISSRSTESGGKLEDLETTVGTAGAGLTDLGDTRLTNLDAAISSRSTYSGGPVQSVTDPVALSSDYNAAKTAAAAVELAKIIALIDPSDPKFTAEALADAPTGGGDPEEIATTILDLANAIDGKTLRQSLQIIAAVIAGKISGARTNAETFKGLDGTTPRVVVTADAQGNRTNVTYP